ncbi:MAG: hypothetical protein ABL921_21370 [Pirellula sp.]
MIDIEKKIQETRLQAEVALEVERLMREMHASDTTPERRVELLAEIEAQYKRVKP